MGISGCFSQAGGLEHFLIYPWPLILWYSYICIWWRHPHVLPWRLDDSKSWVSLLVSWWEPGSNSLTAPFPEFIVVQIWWHSWASVCVANWVHSAVYKRYHVHKLAANSSWDLWCFFVAASSFSSLLLSLLLRIPIASCKHLSFNMQAITISDFVGGKPVAAGLVPPALQQQLCVSFLRFWQTANLMEEALNGFCSMSNSATEIHQSYTNGLPSSNRMLHEWWYTIVNMK